MSPRMTPTNLPKQVMPMQRASLGLRKQPSNLIAASAYRRLCQKVRQPRAWQGDV